MVNIEKSHDQGTSVDQIGKKDTVERAVRLPRTMDEVCCVSSVSTWLIEGCARRRASSSGLRMRL